MNKKISLIFVAVFVFIQLFNLLWLINHNEKASMVLSIICVVGLVIVALLYYLDNIKEALALLLVFGGNSK